MTIATSIAWLFLAAAWPQDSAPPSEAPAEGDPAAPGAGSEAPTPDGPPWQIINEVTLVVNEACTTTFDLHRGVSIEAQRRGLDIKDPRVQQALYQRVMADQATSKLQEQAGRAMGFDIDLVGRITMREVERRREVREAQGLPMTVEDPKEEREEVARYIYGRLHDESVIGKSPGPEGRLMRDRYVRPGMLKFAYLSRGATAHPVGNALREQNEVQMTQLIIDYQSHGGKEGALALATDLYERVLDGDEMGELAEEFGATAPGTRGLSDFVPIYGLRRDHLEVYTFLLTAEIGDVSEPMPFRQGGQEVAIVVIRLDELKALQFDDREMQQQVREAIMEWNDQQRRGRALEDLLKGAYVWPEEVLRSSPSPQSEAANSRSVTESATDPVIPPSAAKPNATGTDLPPDPDTRPGG